MKLKGLTVQKLRWWLLILLAAYAAAVLSFVWLHCYFSPLKGGKNGPLDAYRHTLASAVVAYTASPKTVALITLIMERENRAANLMDRHNNAIGAKIGRDVKSLLDLDDAVKIQVMHGTENAVNANQTTWLPRQYWGNARLW